MTSERRPFDPAEEEVIRRRAKEEIRKRMHAVRKAVPKDARAARSSKIAEHVRALEAWSAARVVAAYVALRGEVDPSALVAEARASGKRVVLPRVDLPRDAITWHLTGDDTNLEPGPLGVLEPPADAPTVAGEAIDLVLVPAVAVDERGHRLGYGRGFYDRALREMPNARRCALAFDFQRLAEIPNTEGDERMNVVVTDRGVHEIE